MSSSNEIAPEQNRYKKNIVLSVLFLGFLLGCAWRFTGLHERFGFATLIGWGQSLQGHPWTLFAVILVYIFAGLIFFAHALLLWVTIFSFDLHHAMLYSSLGSMASAMTLYGLGRVLRKDVVARLAGSYVGEVSRALGRKGILSLFLLHIFPVCPFSVLNLLAGATHIKLRDFLLGTLLGMLPGLMLLWFFGEQFIEIIRKPHLKSGMVLLGFIGVGVFVLSHAKRRWLPRTGPQA
jgi:phospholipase D1/2